MSPDDREPPRGAAARGAAASGGGRSGRPPTLEELEAELAAGPPGTADLGSPNAKLRRDTLDRLVARRDPAALPAVVRRLAVEDNPFVLSRVLSAVGALSCGRPDHAPEVARLLSHPDPRVVANALDALRAMRAGGFAGQVEPLLESKVPRVRASAVLHLAATEPGFSPGLPIERMLASGEPGTQCSALFAVRELGQIELARTLRLAGSTTDPEVAFRLDEVAREMAGLGSEEARELLRELEAGPIARGEALQIHSTPLVKRVWAWLVDSAVLAALAFAGLVAIVVARGQHGPSPMRELLADAQLVMLLYSVVFFVRDGFGSGRGLAKRYMGLRVVDLESRSGCGFVQSMLRQATFYLPVVNVIEVAWAAFDPQKQRLVDHLLGTMVIDERRVPLNRFDWLVLWLMGLGLVLGTVAVVALVWTHGWRPLLESFR